MWSLSTDISGRGAICGYQAEPNFSLVGMLFYLISPWTYTIWAKLYWWHFWDLSLIGVVSVIWQSWGKVRILAVTLESMYLGLLLIFKVLLDWNQVKTSFSLPPTLFLTL